MSPIVPPLSEHPAVQKVLNLGYTIEYEWDDKDRPSRSLYSRVSLEGDFVGDATVTLDWGLREQTVENIGVVEEHQRKGIGNAMMLCSIQLTGCRPEPAVNQTEEGRAWWGQDGRPW
jgi:hypothetical protein